jgi:hypothetical protein
VTCVMLFNAVRGSQLVVSHERRIPQSTVVKIVHKRLRLCAYKVQLVQALEPDDHPRRAAFVTEMLERIDEDNDYLTRVCFSDKATFHSSGKVNIHSARIWGLKNPHVVLENQRDSPKLNIWCVQLHN